MSEDEVLVDSEGGAGAAYGANRGKTEEDELKEITMEGWKPNGNGTDSVFTSVIPPRNDWMAGYTGSPHDLDPHGQYMSQEEIDKLKKHKGAIRAKQRKIT